MNYELLNKVNKWNVTSCTATEYGSHDFKIKMLHCYYRNENIHYRERKLVNLSTLCGIWSLWRIDKTLFTMLYHCNIKRDIIFGRFNLPLSNGVYKLNQETSIISKHYFKCPYLRCVHIMLFCLFNLWKEFYNGSLNLPKLQFKVWISIVQKKLSKKCFKLFFFWS